MAAATEITFWSRDGAGAPVITQEPEEATQTFEVGVPVYAQAADGMTAEVTANFSNTEIVLGIAVSNGQNLAVQDTAEAGVNVRTPPNQASAVTVPIGAPILSGKTEVIHADAATVFRVGLIDTQSYTAALKLPDTQYELERQANGFWQVDSTDTVTDATTDHVVEIVGVDPNDNEFVLVRFATGRRAF